VINTDDVVGVAATGLSPPPLLQATPSTKTQPAPTQLHHAALAALKHGDLAATGIASAEFGVRSIVLTSR
jgi:hypothetical protein